MRIPIAPPNHEARFANIAECFPLAAARNLRKWVGDEAARRAAGMDTKIVERPYWPKDENIILL